MSQLPDGWDLFRLEQIAVARGGTSFPPALQGRVSGDLPFYKVSDMNLLGNEVQMSLSSNWIEHNDLHLLRAKTFPPKTTIFPKVGGALHTNKKRFLSREALVDNNIMGLISRDVERCLPEFLFTWFQTVNLSSIANAGPLPSINAHQLYDLLVPLPETGEQRSIVSVLDLCSAGITHERRAESLSTELKRAVMTRLFTRGLRGEVQKETEVGSVPLSWEETNLSALCSGTNGRIQTGPFGSQLHAHEYQDEGVPVINPTHLEGNRINHENIPKVSTETAARLQRHQLEPGDILFARRGEIGRHGLVRQEESGWLCGTGCFVVRVRHRKIDNAFLARLFSTERIIAWLAAHAAGTIMPNLNNVVLGKLPVLIPSLDEQREIVAILDAVDRKIALHRQKRAVLEDLFQSLLHKLMTGEIRVSDLDLSALPASPARLLGTTA